MSARTLLPHSTIALSVFIVPLLPTTGRWLDPAPWIGAAVALSILVTQPTPDAKEMLSATNVDRRSALFIFVAMIGAQFAAVIEFGYSGLHTDAAHAIRVTLGAAFAAAGVALRMWAIRTLGVYFTATVRVRDAQPVIESGPYRLLRHPSYTGAMLAALGAIVALGSGLGVVLFVLIIVPAYLYRMCIEERALLGRLGDSYTSYRARTWRLVPGLY